MRLPRGTLIYSCQGPKPLSEISDSIRRDAFTGYLRVSIIRNTNGIVEGICIYLSGQLIISLTSEGDNDRPDPEQKRVAEIANSSDAIIELCSLNDAQINLMKDLAREFAIRPDTNTATVTNHGLISGTSAPGELKKARNAVRAGAGAPDIRGQFIKSEHVDSIRDYLAGRNGETGHAVFIVEKDGSFEEYHMILIKGTVEAAYSNSLMGARTIDHILDMSGQIEFYYLDESIISSLLKRYPETLVKARGSTGEQDREGHRHNIGIPARELLEDVYSKHHNTEDGKVSGVYNEHIADTGYDDKDIAFVKKVEHDFADSVDDLLRRLELSHLRVSDTKKKR